MDRVTRFDSFMRRINNKYYFDNKRMDRAYQIITNHIIQSTSDDIKR